MKAKPAYGGKSVPTPRVLFMTPDGKIVAEEDNYASEEQFLATLKKVVAAHSEFMKPTAEEQALATPEQRARLACELLDPAGARRELEGVDSDYAHYLRGHLDRCEGRWEAMNANFEKVRDPLFVDDIRIERAYRFWVGGDVEKLREALAGFPTVSNRYTEARYYEGLALFHVGKVGEAQEVWQSTIKACPQDAWVYRADWAYCGSKQTGTRVGFSSRGPRTSCLNRIGYMGRKNPDLARRER